ncbi:MAG: type II toxin-antitoxin system RelE/ParE family toxin [Chlorobiaceae bacterium]|jgi:mRNA interferase RelE/StbE
MACYSIQWKKSAVKELQKIAKQVIPDIVEAVNALAVDPLPLGSKKIRGSLQTYRIRRGDYRIIYSIEEDCLVVQVITVGHRKDIYQKFNL